MAVDREPRYPDATSYLEDDDMTKSPIQVYATLNSAPKVPTDMPQEYPDTWEAPEDKDTGMSKRIAAPIQSLVCLFAHQIANTTSPLPR